MECLCEYNEVSGMKVAKALAAVVLIILIAACALLAVFLRAAHIMLSREGPAYTEGMADQQARLEEYIQTHSEAALGEVLTFEWDEAYIDRRPYGTGESVRQLTGYEFEVKELNDEYWNRLLFFKDGQLVKELVYSWFEWSFPVELQGFTPQTVFSIEAEPPRYFLTVAGGYEGTAMWDEQRMAAQQGESGAPPAQTPPASSAA